VHDLDDLAGSRSVGHDPWPPVGIEHRRQAMNALGSMDTPLRVESDNDLVCFVCLLSHRDPLVVESRKE